MQRLVSGPFENRVFQLQLRRLIRALAQQRTVKRGVLSRPNIGHFLENELELERTHQEEHKDGPHQDRFTPSLIGREVPILPNNVRRLRRLREL